MTDVHLPYTCDENAIQNLIQYCQEHQYTNFNLVNDQNTQRVLGEEGNDESHIPRLESE